MSKRSVECSLLSSVLIVFQRNIVISKSPTVFNRWLSSMYYLINGPDMQVSNYENVFVCSISSLNESKWL